MIGEEALTFQIVSYEKSNIIGFYVTNFYSKYFFLKSQYQKLREMYRSIARKT